MKRKLLILSACAISCTVNAQVTFTPFFSQNFESSTDVNTYFLGHNAPNNSTNMGTFTPVLPQNSETGISSVSIATETSQVLKISKNQTSANTYHNKYHLYRNFDFSGSAVPQRIKFEYKVRLTNTTADANTYNLQNNYINLGPLETSNPNNGAGNDLFNINYTARRTATGVFTYYDNAENTVNTISPSASYTEYVWFVNNSGASYDYTAPDATTKSVGAGKVDVWIKLDGGSWNNYKNDAALNNNTPFGSLKIANNANSWNGAGTVPFSGETYIDDIVISSADASVLPVELISFAGIAKSKTVRLDWKTASENNNKKFEIQRSLDGKNFSTIGTVAGAGISRELQNYTFTDDAPAAKTNYYRLQQFDYDGTVHTSKIIAVKSNVEETSLFIYTQYGKTKVEVVTGTAGQAKLYIADISGKIVVTINPQLSKGYNTVTLDQNLGSGIYVASLLEGQNLSTKKFAVQ